MSKSFIDNFEKSLKTGFLDKSINSDKSLQPQLLINSKTPPLKVLSTIIDQLTHCESFLISVAFVTTGGIASLINCFKKLELKNIKGKVLVSKYLNFTHPEALKRLMKFKNIELKIADSGNLHIKGYIFKYEKHYNLIIGSSNLTASALSANNEWNLKVSTLNSSSLIDNVLREFKSNFNSSISVSKKFITEYEKIHKKQHLFYKENKLAQNQKVKIIPNSMQVKALKNLKNLRKKNEDKAIIISATGTGKSYLSAFDAKTFNPKKLLFVVHRLTIAKSAMQTFQSIFDHETSMGLYSGNDINHTKDFIFSTVQTISKDHHLKLFNKDHFDYIIIDESHRSGANSYIKLIDYFQPKFLLGMTATPERTDGNDIFSLFDHNIAYEIRLRKAMEENMLCQFHYYGVADLIINDNNLENKARFNFLTSDERVKKIIENSNFYGSDNGVLRGLIFCSEIKEAKEFSRKLNKKGYKTIALTSDSSESDRTNAIKQLEDNDLNKKLDYIITVDIFNEGVDIPKVNQIIMLRPTESAIIFTQQLGRGLRKAEGKNYLTVIDFIGNYNNNYLIPIALYGDTSYKKDTLRKLIYEGSTMIPGTSTINFDEITKERIFKSIESANMSLLVNLKKDYSLLKFKLGRIPMMLDFINHGSRDPFLYIEYSKSYYNFVKKIEKTNVPDLNIERIKLLELFSKEINNTKRIEETIILRELIKYKKLDIARLKTIINKKYNHNLTEATINSCLNNINFNFINKSQKIINLDTTFSFTSNFLKKLTNHTFKEFLIDNIKYAYDTYNTLYRYENFIDGFLLYEKYTRKDVCRILNWEKNYESTIYGYKIHNNCAPLFVTYNKSDNISSTTKYNDHFINPQKFAWESKANRTLNSQEIINLSESQENGLKILLFIQKSNDEGRDFYFMGEIETVKDSIKQDVKYDENNKEVPVVHFTFNMKNTVKQSLYDYLTSNDYEEKKIILPKPETFHHQKTLKKIETKICNKILPFYNFYAAAGTFSEMQNAKEFELIEMPTKYKPNRNYFACKIIGESMNKIIPNGSICLFTEYIGGSRNGKIVLVENYNNSDNDFNSAFTIKTYTSQKMINNDSWEHSSIVLKPNSYDQSYEDIVLDEESASEMRIVGIFIDTL